MNPVEVVPAPGGTLILRARGSELLILPNHIVALQKLNGAKDFTTYFMKDALINRPARKLFEAWLRKDGSLWKRIYHTVHKEIEVDKDVLESLTKGKEDKPAAAEKKAEPKKEAPAKAAKEDKKEEAKTATKKKAAKEDKKEEAKTATKKKATKKAAKSESTTKKTAAKKKTTKKATKSTSTTKKKTAAKKTTTKKTTTTKKKTAAKKTTTKKTTKKKTTKK